MAKLSKYIFGACALGFSDAAVNYETVSCNNDENVSKQTNTDPINSDSKNRWITSVLFSLNFISKVFGIFY